MENRNWTRAELEQEVRATKRERMVAERYGRSDLAEQATAKLAELAEIGLEMDHAEAQAVAELVAEWDALVAEGKMGEAEMAETLVGMEDAELLENALVVKEAARQWLVDHPNAWMTADPELAEQVADMLGPDTPEWLKQQLG